MQGRLRCKEQNRVALLDPYLQLERRIDAQWRLLAGLRASTVSFDVGSAIVNETNGSITSRLRAVPGSRA